MNKTSIKNKNIVFIFDNLELGGAERQGFLLANFLQKECGANVQIWGLNKQSGTLALMCDEVGIIWKAVRFNWRMRHRPLSFLNLVCQLWKFNVDILIPYTSIPNIVCGLAWKLTPAKTCAWNQEDEGLMLTRSMLHRLAVRLTPLFISNSSGGMEFLKQNYNLEKKNAVVIHNGVYLAPPRDDRGTWRGRLGLPEKRLVACMLANIHPPKDHVTLLKAWKHVIAENLWGGDAPCLLLAGRIDSGHEELVNLGSELGIQENVKFIGKVDDVSGLLLSIDLCIHSSVSEGLPNSVLEAMACGVPVVGTDIPGIREAVGPNGEGFLAPIGDEAGLGKVITTILKNSKLSADLASSQKIRIEQEFMLSHMCEKTALLLDNAIT